MSRVSGYLRYPHVHGDLLTFTAQDDVWLAPVTGGRSWRFSSDRAPVSHPRFSRDGTRIAWTSWRDGGPEVYTAETEGSQATQSTFWGDPRTRVTGWNADGEILVISAAAQHAVKHTVGYAIGDTPRLLPFGQLKDLAVEAEGTALLTGAVPIEPAYWKRYRGGRAGKLWTATQDEFQRILGHLTGQLASPMLLGGRLFFLSDHEGTGNIYSCGVDGDDIRRHTDHDGHYARNPATDGERIVYHVAGDIWILDPAEADPRRLDITLTSPAAARAPKLITAADHLGGLDCDPAGQASVIEVRGTVHWLTHKDGPARLLAAAPDARARLPRVLGDTGKAVWVTDKTGVDAIEIGGPDAPPVILAAGLIGSVTSLAASPDGTKVAAAVRDGRLLAVDVASGEVTELAASVDGEIEGLAWSPDSAWLAWSQPVMAPLSAIRIARIGGKPAEAIEVTDITDVTDGRFTDTEPVFTTDGRYLAFLSQRTFDPVYDAHAFDMSFPYGTRPYLVPLAASELSPFGPLPAGRPLADPAADSKGDSKGDSNSTGDSSKNAPVTVHTRRMSARVVGVPVPEARYSSLRAVKGGLAWLRTPVAGVLGEGGAAPDADQPRPVLERFDLAKREVTELGEADWFKASADGTRLVVRDGKKLKVRPSGSGKVPDGKQSQGKSDDTVTVDLTRARFTADPVALWRHAYTEAGRMMRRDFWTPGMSGVDWDAELAAYRPLVDRLGSADDFADLLWELFGELGTSHAYVTAVGGSVPAGGPGGGQLGADIVRDGAGRWIVARVLPGESSDPLARSPLEAAGIEAGDELVEVDGQPVDQVRGPWPLLAGVAGKPVELTVRSSGELRRAALVPLADERRLRYQDWVAGRRRLVRELGEGRLGYLHVLDMVGSGWAHFNRDLRTEMAWDGLIIDVRGNSGGHISELVVEKLAWRVLGWVNSRWSGQRSHPRVAPRGPVVTVADEFAGSDGDIVTASIRDLGLGPVVGTRTWGGVVGIDERRRLVDGTLMSVPGYAFWFCSDGWGVENHGVDPDVEVLIAPGDLAAGRDPQLETAVRLALEALEKQPPAVPPDPETGPVKTRPPLPPRR
jgi:tricorn protease